MTLPAELVDEIEAAVGERVVAVEAVGGGCISNTTRLQLASGDAALLKWSDSMVPAKFFAEEAASLAAIADTRSVRVPAVLHVSKTAERQWLLLEWLEPGQSTSQNQRILGEQLAALHRTSSASFGWPRDNFIGSLPQSNASHDTWSTFWRDERIRPQLRMASSRLTRADLARFDALLDDLPTLLREVEDEPPALLHGDLWSGNVHMLTDGQPALIDPSSYFGQREVDIAMSRLFGGFDNAFYEAYASAWPHRQGLERRIHVYQLYYLLVHVNLFGGAYGQQTMAVLGRLGY